jgi:hypothetical protein
MAHAKWKTVPLPGRVNRKGKDSASMLYQLSMPEHIKVDRVAGSHTELLTKKCNRCGDRSPTSGFAPVFEEFDRMLCGRALQKRVLLCNKCWWEY